MCLWLQLPKVEDSSSVPAGEHVCACRMPQAKTRTLLFFIRFIARSVVDCVVALLVCCSEDSRAGVHLQDALRRYCVVRQLRALPAILPPCLRQCAFAFVFFLSFVDLLLFNRCVDVCRSCQPTSCKIRSGTSRRSRVSGACGK